MTVFAILACLMLATALLFILPPLLRRDGAGRAHAQRDQLNLEVLRDQLRELDADLAAGTLDAAAYGSARQELERLVVEDVLPAAPIARADTARRWPALAIALAVMIVAGSLYHFYGTPNALDPAQRAGTDDAAHKVTAEQIEGMVAKLAQRMKSKPDDAEGWHMLARSYAALGRFAESADAYQHLVKLVPDNADLLADYADALGMSLNRTLQGEPEKIVLRALAVDPKSVKALALAGSAAFERHDYPAAIVQWKKILAIVPADSEAATSTASNISEAQRLAEGRPAMPSGSAPALASASDATAAATPASQPAAEGASASPVATAKSQIVGMVELDPALRGQVADTDTVFIFARAAQGPRFPLAVARKLVKDLPTAFMLDDTMSMVPNAKLSNFPLVVVGARISKTGNATPSAGDLEGSVEAVKPGATDVKIRINSKRS